jgi:hypothetical protein
VEEVVPARRTRPDWLLRRAFREGNASLYAERAQRPGSRQTGRQLLRACARVAYGLGHAVRVPVGGRAAMLRSARQFAYAAGTFAALAGHRHYEYGRDAGEEEATASPTRSRSGRAGQVEAE